MDEVLQDQQEATGATTADATEAPTVRDEPGAPLPPPPQQQWPGYAPGYPQPGYYGAPHPGFPMPPGPPVMPPTQNGGEGRRSRGLMIGGLGVLVLLILGAGIAIVVAMSGSHPVVVARPAAQTLSTSTTAAPAVAPQLTRTVTKTAAVPPPPTAAPAPTPTAGDAAQIETMLNAHFQNLVNGNYGAAWADLTGNAAAAAGSESEWISGEQSDGLYSFSLTVAPQITSSTTVTADITHFVTRASGSGCKSWTGDWSLVQEHGQWLISAANLNGSLSPCNA
jgi:hypothetical protein